MLTAENNEHWIVQQAHRIPDHTAINSKQIILSYNDLLRSSEKTASYLLAKGINEDDRICIISKHCSEFISVLNAIWLLGAVPIPISDKLKDHEFDEIIDHSSAKYLINLDPGLKIILRQNILFIDFTKALLSEEVNYNFQYNDFDPSKICLMLYTSGSSGKPKCVNFRFTDLYASAVLVDSYINHKLDDKWILSLPLNHIGGFSTIVRSLIAGCSIVIPKNLKHSELADSINQFQPSLLSLVPLMMKRLMKDYRSPWSNLRHIFIGGGPVENNLIGKA
jgi:O-succinylbenzoic acid--CoA ligase